MCHPLGWFHLFLPSPTILIRIAHFQNSGSFRHQVRSFSASSALARYGPRDPVVRCSIRAMAPIGRSSEKSLQQHCDGEARRRECG